MPGGNPGIPEAESGNFIWSRRDLLSLAGWGAILTCFALAGAAILRLLFPRVLFEPPTSFRRVTRSSTRSGTSPRSG